MWTVLFGEHDAPAAAPSSPVDKELELDDDQENQQPSPRNNGKHAHASASHQHNLQGKMRLSIASTAASSPPLSPSSNADSMRFSSESASTIRVSESSSLAPSPPTSQGRRVSGSSAATNGPPVIPAPPGSTSSRRGSRGQFNSEADDDDAQQTPMAMLLRRMNQLMMKVGEHEFEKKTLVDGMEKDRERLTKQIKELERQIEDLKDQNVQLQYKLEFTTEPMLMEQLQDVTDMRDALTSVKIQLEQEIGAKDKELVECRAALNAAIASKEQEIQQIREQYNHEIHEIECERDELEQRAADATKLAEEEAQAKYTAQLEAKDMSIAELTQIRATLEGSLWEKEEVIEELQIDRQVVAQQKHDEIAQLNEDLEATRQSGTQELEALKTRFEVTISEKESELSQLRADLVNKSDVTERELRSRIEELEKQVSDSETVISEMTQEIGDYKEDCVNLWKANEDLKQQIALASAETMLRDAEMRENALSGQTALLDKVNELEYQLQVMQEQLNEENQELTKLQAEARSVEPATPQVTPVDKQTWKGGAIRILTDQVAAAQRELSDAMNLNLHLNNRNTWLEEQYKLLSAGAAEKVNKNANELEKKVKELEQQMADKQHVIQSTEEQYGALLAQFNQLQYANADLSNANNGAQEQIYQLTQEWQSLNQEVLGLRSSNSAMVQEIEQLKSAAAGNDSSNELFALQQELSQLRGDHSALVQDLENTRSAHTDAVNLMEALRRSEQELKLANDELTNQVNESQSASSLLAESSNVQTELENTISTLKTENGTLQQELESVKAAYSEAAYYAEQFRSVDFELQALRATHEKLISELQAIQESFASVTKENADLKKSVSAHEGAGAQRISELTFENESLSQQLNASQTLASESQSKLRDLQSQCESQKSDIASLEHQLKNLQEFSQETAYEAETKYEEAMLDLEDVRKQLQTKIDECAQLQQTASEAIQSAQSAGGLHENLERARHEIYDLNAQVQHLRSVEQDLTVQLSRTNQTNEQLSVEVAAVKSERLVVEQELSGLKASFFQQQSELENRYQEAAMRAQNVEAAQTELQRENDEISVMLDDDRAKIAHLEQQLAGTTGEYGKLHAQIETLTKKNLALRSEVEGAREEAEQKAEAAQALVDTLRASQSELKSELANLTRMLQSKDAEFAGIAQQSQGEIQNLKSAVARFQEENSRIISELNQLRAEAEQLRAAESESVAAKNALAAELEHYKHEVGRTQHLLQQAESEKSALEGQASQVYALEGERNQLMLQLQQAQQSSHHLEESNRELESALEKSKHFCEDLSARCEESTSQVQEYAKKIQEDSQNEIYRLMRTNDALQKELEHFAQARYREASAEEELHLHIAELQAENNVLAARAHRLTQQLSQFTEVPEEDRLADSQSQTPDLWELLSSGMEQLKADLELASKYAASIDANGLERRQEASKDALLLRNRIALLKAEEEKAWEKIEQTRKRAAELLRVRENNDRSQAELRELAQLAEKELQASIIVKRELVLSIDSIQKKKEMGMQITEARRSEAHQLKEEKQKWREFTEKKKKEELMDAIRRKEEVAMQKEALKTKKLMHKQEIEKMTKERASEKIRAEEDLIRKRETEVQEMERMELELIQRLRNTQHLQKQAFEELEAALTGSGAGLHSPGKDSVAASPLRH